MPKQQRCEVELVLDAAPDEAEAAAREVRRLVAQWILRSMTEADKAAAPPEAARD